MIGILAVAWLAAGILTVSLRHVQACFTPGWQVRILGIGASVLALATLSSTLALLCAVCVRWGFSVPALWGVVGVGVVLTAWRPLVHLQRTRRLHRAGQVFRRSGRAPEAVLIVDDEVAQAFAVPGRGRTVVATTALREALSAAEFDAVLRHEWAHLRHHHQVYVQMAELAACLNPLLRRWCGAVRFAAERHADEHAAQAGRVVAARALAKVALLTSRARPVVPGQLAISADAAAVVRRVHALHAPEPRRQRAVPVLAAVLALAVITADLVSTGDWIQDRLIPENGEPVSAVYG